ncbi:MAG: DNA methylase [Aetokthonos hydrillicola CCALA 1050]|nr:DNA methylase [Aetokthonos hydrillicola CCALA 1050]
MNFQAVTPANDNQPILVQAVNGLRSALASQSWDALLSLTHSWSGQLKKDAWRCLSQKERQAIHLLSASNRNRLIHGDCIHVMKTLPNCSVDFILTDPPYLVRYKSRDGRSIANDDNDRWLLPAFSEMYRVLKDNSFCVSFYGWNRVDRFMEAWRKAGFTPVGHFTFNKSYASSARFTRSCHENAYLLAKGRPDKPQKPIRDILPWKYTGNTLHPTQKPVEPLAQLIAAFSKPGEVVLDPFAGSASTAVAAWQTGRHYIAIEKDPNYHAIAQQRLSRLGE